MATEKPKIIIEYKNGFKLTFTKDTGMPFDGNFGKDSFDFKILFDNKIYKIEAKICQLLCKSCNCRKHTKNKILKLCQQKNKKK